MSITTQVRVNWPVPPILMLDVATRAIGAEPHTILRTSGRDHCENAIAGLKTHLGVQWVLKGRPRTRWSDRDGPEAYVVLTMDSTYGPNLEGFRTQAYELLPAVRDWLDSERHVTREMWWWQDDYANTWHPGTTPVEALLDGNIEREVWTP